MHIRDITEAGQPVEQARRILIMLHGRGASSRDILTLSEHLNIKDYALLAPQAANNTWYPYSFLSPPALNEPGLTSALELISAIIKELNKLMVTTDRIYLLGFSQGACLALEFAARNAMKYGGIAAFTGGLIGDRLYRENYRGDFQNTPVFIGTSDPDIHVPTNRVKRSADILTQMNARVSLNLYPGMGHIISMDEIDTANKLIFT